MNSDIKKRSESRLSKGQLYISYDAQLRRCNTKLGGWHSWSECEFKTEFRPMTRAGPASTKWTRRTHTIEREGSWNLTTKQEEGFVQNIDNVSYIGKNTQNLWFPRIYFKFNSIQFYGYSFMRRHISRLGDVVELILVLLIDYTSPWKAENSRPRDTLHEYTHWLLLECNHV